MKDEGSGGPEELQEIEVVRKGLEDANKLFGVQGKAFSEAVEGGFGNAEMLTEGKEGGELPGKPGIKK